MKILPKIRINELNSGCCIHHIHFTKSYKQIFDLVSCKSSEYEGGYIISDINNGKTTLALKFVQDEKVNFANRTLLYIEMPEKCTVKEFCSEILNTMGFPIVSTSPENELKSKMKTGLKNQNVLVLFLDDFHRLTDYSYKKKQEIMALIWQLIDELQIKIFFIGNDKLKSLINAFPRLKSKFININLPKWQYDQIYLDLLRSFEKYLKFSYPSHLDSPSIAQKILKLSHGRIGGIFRIIRTYAIHAIRKNIEKITLDLIENCESTFLCENS